MKQTIHSKRLNVMLLALGALHFAAKDTKSGGSGGATTTDNGGSKAPASQSTTGAVTEAAKQTGEEAKAKRPELTINSLAQINELPQAEREKLLEGAKTRASKQAGTVGIYLREDGTETTNKEEAKRAMGGSGRVIAKYTPPRHPNEVAAEELTRMMRLGWSRAAREAVNKRMTGRKNPLSEDELVKILLENGAPESYLRPKASKRLFGRVLSFIQAGPLPASETAQQQEVATMANK